MWSRRRQRRSTAAHVSHLLVERPLWTRLLLLVFAIHTHVEFVLAEGAAQQGEHQEEPHGSAAGDHDRHQRSWYIQVYTAGIGIYIYICVCILI